MAKVGTILLMLGVTMGDSECLWIPVVVMGLGMLLICLDKKI